MKPILFCSILFLSGFIFAGPGEDFQAGLQLYTSGNLDQAKLKFKSAGEGWEILAQKKTSESALWFNAGNAYYLMEDKFSALRMWFKALELNPTDSAALKNWNLIQKEFPEKLKSENPSVFGLFTPGILQMGLGVLGISFSIWSGLIGWQFWKRGEKSPKLWWWGISTIFLGAVWLCLGTIKPDTAFVQVSAPLLKGDSQVYENTLDLLPGTLVQILEVRSGYSRVRLSSGGEGWVDSQSLISTGK